MRLRYVVLFSILLLLMLALAVYFFVKSELDYLKVYIPSIDNISLQPREVYTEIYGKDDVLMYKHYYVKSSPLSSEDDITHMVSLLDIVIGSKIASNVSSDIPFWKTLIMELQDIDPTSLRGVVYDYYAEGLLNKMPYRGFRAEIIRWYTLKSLQDKYSDSELYLLLLNSIKYADNVYGIVAAARHFFSKDISECKHAEISFLISMLSSDDNTLLEPYREYARIDGISRRYLFMLYESGMLTPDEYEASKLTNVTLIPERYSTLEPSIVREILSRIDSDQRFDKDKQIITIKTGYDVAATNNARHVIQRYLADKDIDLQVAYVLANSRTKEIEVAIGSRIIDSYKNRAFTMKRQMASTFKPFVYMPAFDEGLTPDDTVTDMRYTFRTGLFTYQPRNYENAYYGVVSLRSALVFSLNNATIKLAENVGLAKVRDTAVKSGLQGNILPVHSMAIGAYSATPLTVAQMYSVIANRGIRQHPDIIQTVEADGIVYDMVERPTRIAKTSSAYEVLLVMQDVARRGTARGANLLAGTAVKTGTSNDYVDSWSVAIFDDYIAAVWLGYDDFKGMGKDGAGGTLAAKLLSSLQREYYDDDEVFEIK